MPKLKLQKQYNKPVLYEGSVCGSIPILRNLEEYYDNDLIQSVDGIFNGSTKNARPDRYRDGANQECGNTRGEIPGST